MRIQDNIVRLYTLCTSTVVLYGRPDESDLTFLAAAVATKASQKALQIAKDVVHDRKDNVLTTVSGYLP